MSESRAEFQKFLEEDIAKNKGILYPAKASIFEQMFKRKVAIDKLHPNPDDEFCFSEVGPSYKIIAGYEEKFRKAADLELDPFSHEPLMIEKMYTDGYMILNGHHRWAAARNLGFKKVPVKIVNITHEDDIRKMLEASNKQKRVTFDLDEVIFDSPDGAFEKERGLFKGRYEKVRLGVPALFHYFYTRGYDIWVFSSQYYSIEYVRHLFGRYGVRVDGIVTGTARKTASNVGKKRQIEELLSQKYAETVSVDNEAVVITRRGDKEFEQISLNMVGHGWSAGVMDAMKNII